MKKILVSLTISLPVMLLIAACGNTKETKTDTEKKIENRKPDKPVVSFVLDGRLIESADYYCGWKLTGRENMLTLSIVYDREPKTNPPNLGFAIYNLKNISMPFNRLNGKLPGKSEQLFSLSVGLGLPKGKAANMNELSFSDNYKGLQSAVKLSLLDTTAKIVSGQFEGTVQNANGKKMVISAGKFNRISLQMIYK
jgi:hypothetical protein